MNLRTTLQMVSFFFVGLLTTCVAINVLPSLSDTSAETASTDLPHGAKVELARQTATSMQTTSDLLSQFEKFAPANSTLLCLARTGRIFESPIADIAPPAMQSDAREKAKDIVFAAMATNQESLSDMITHRSRRAFALIAAELSDEGKDSIENEAAALTIVNILNHNFSGMFQFKKATDWSTLKTFLTRDDEFDGEFFETEWNGYQILECDQEDSCVVIRLDSRTFVIGNKAQLTNAISSGKGTSEAVAKWIADPEATNFDGEFFFAINLKSKPDGMLGGMPPLMPPSIEDFKLAVDMRNGPLVHCQSSFNEPEELQKLIQEIKSHTSQWIRQAESRMEQVASDESFDEWQVRQMLAIAKSIKFEAINTTASITIPRPDDFDALVREYGRRLNSVMQKYERSLEQFSQPVNAVAMETVVVATKSIQRGAVISADDIKVENWPEEIIPSTAFKSREAILKRKAAVTISKGFPITQHSITQDD